MLNIHHILQCPDCQNPIHTKANNYHCLACNREFDVEEGIPVLLPKNFSGEEAAEADFHSAIAASWEEENQMESEHVRSVHMRFLAHLFELKQDSLILEVGCGTGWDGIQLARRGMQVVETDISVGMLQVANMTATREGFHERVCHIGATADTLPFADESFDAVFCAAALHHFDDPACYLREMHRIIKVGGLVVIGAEPSGWFGVLLRRYLGLKKVLSSAQHAPGDESAHGFSPKKFRQLATSAGLDVVAIQADWYSIGFAHYAIGPISKLLRLKHRPPIPLGIERFLISFDKLIARIPLAQHVPWLCSLIAVRKH